MQLIRRKAANGDTIVEVMISMAILGLVIGVSFATARHALQSGLQSGYRDQAQSYGQQQIELLKDIDDQDNLFAGGFLDTSSNGFCVIPSTKTHFSIPPTGPNQCIFPSPDTPPASQYSVKDSYTGSDSGQSKTFVIKVSWASSSSDTPNQITLNYKPHNSFVACSSDISCYAPPTASSSTTPASTTWMCFRTNLSSPANCGPDDETVNVGTNLTLTWTTAASPPASSCAASGGYGAWNGGPPGTGNHTSGTYPTGPLPQGGPYAFKLTCYDALGNPALSKTINITVHP